MENNKLNWSEILKQFVQDKMQKEHEQMSDTKTSISFPDVRTSGSISEEEMELFIEEIKKTQKAAEEQNIDLNDPKANIAVAIIGAGNNAPNIIEMIIEAGYKIPEDVVILDAANDFLRGTPLNVFEEMPEVVEPYKKTRQPWKKSERNSHPALNKRKRR